jgi:hypothetical protein
LIIVDPPEGWKYGFPAPLKDDYEKQLKESGYPKKDIPFALKHSRYWGWRNEESLEEN